MKTFLPLFLLFFSQTGFSQIDSLKKYYQLGMVAYEEGDYPGFRDQMVRADSFRPYYSPVTYNVGAGYALTGDAAQASNYLKTYLTMNSQTDFQADTDFDKIRLSPEFQSAIELAEKLAEKVIASQPFLAIPGTGHIETIAFDKKPENLYLGDVRERKVYAYNLKSKTLEILFDYEQHTELFSVMGLDYDRKNGKLWVCSTMMPQALNYDSAKDGWSSIYSFDLKTKKVGHHGTVKEGSVFGDLIVSKTGKVLISDGGRNKLFTIDQMGKLIEFADLSDQIYNLQGLTLSEDEKTLFVSDYISGVFSMNMDSKALTKIQFEPGTPFRGIDGLYYSQNSLFALENGSKPMRTIQFMLDQTATKIAYYTILDQNVDYLNEPTQGALYKNALIYISNSPWAAYDQENNFIGGSDLQLRRIYLK